jgi:hypothetical protein
MSRSRTKDKIFRREVLANPRENLALRRASAST